ncbi:MAG TPA: hypothetical protein PK702_11305 [Burkholderiaceae bacterium]|nr:hypothetical protein [Burkholderiaceae bacterium]
MYEPNKIDPVTRFWNIFLSTCLLIYGTVGIINDEIFIPGRRSRGALFHGEPAWVLYGAMICASLNLISVVIDHYDTRNNEINYKRFAQVTQYLGWGLFILALVLDSFVYQKATRL